MILPICAAILFASQQGSKIDPAVVKSIKLTAGNQKDVPGTLSPPAFTERVQPLSDKDLMDVLGEASRLGNLKLELTKITGPTLTLSTGAVFLAPKASWCREVYVRYYSPFVAGSDQTHFTQDFGATHTRGVSVMLNGVNARYFVVEAVFDTRSVGIAGPTLIADGVGGTSVEQTLPGGMGQTAIFITERDPEHPHEARLFIHFAAGHSDLRQISIRPLG